MGFCCWRPGTWFRRFNPGAGRLRCGSAGRRLVQDLVGQRRYPVGCRMEKDCDWTSRLAGSVVGAQCRSFARGLSVATCPVGAPPSSIGSRQRHRVLFSVCRYKCCLQERLDTARRVSYNNSADFESCRSSILKHEPRQPPFRRFVAYNKRRALQSSSIPELETRASTSQRSSEPLENARLMSALLMLALPLPAVFLDSTGLRERSGLGRRSAIGTRRCGLEKAA